MFAVSTPWLEVQFHSATSQWPQIISLLPNTDILLGNTHTEKGGNTRERQKESLEVPGTKSLSPHKAFPSTQSSCLMGVFRGFAKAVHFAKQIFPFGCQSCCWKLPLRLHCADWGTVEIVHSKVRRGERGRIVVWASFYPGSMAQRKGWLVCPISKPCHIFGYRDKSSRLTLKRAVIVTHKNKKQTPESA